MSRQGRDIAVVHGVGLKAGEFFGKLGETLGAAAGGDDVFAHLVEFADKGFTYAAGAAELWRR